MSWLSLTASVTVALHTNCSAESFSANTSDSTTTSVLMFVRPGGIFAKRA